MPIELTDEDRANIASALVPFQTNSGSRQAEMIDALYRAGLAAMNERAAKVADSYEPICDRCPQGCPAAIRALLK